MSTEFCLRCEKNSSLEADDNHRLALDFQLDLFNVRNFEQEYTLSAGKTIYVEIEPHVCVDERVWDLMEN